MVTIGALWLPILLSAVIVWIASAIAWTIAPHHKSDFRVIPDQDDFLANTGKRNLAPGQYWFPYSTNPKDMQSPEMMAKMEQGPVGLLTIWSAGKPNMGKPMMLSGIYYVMISLFVAYIAGRTLVTGAEYLSVFRVAGAVTFVAYAGALIPDAIWFGTPWSRTWKSAGDALVYALLTAGMFGWLWPAM